MRVSTNYQFQSMNEYITAAQERIFSLGQVVSTGIKLDEPSDDPYAASLVLSFRTALANNAQFQQNIGTVTGRLKTTEASLTEVTDLIAEAKQLVLAGANSSTDQVARDGMAAQVGRIQERLVQIGNTQLTDGHYLFAGRAASTKPFTVTNNTLTFNGDGTPMQVQIQNSTIVSASVVGSPLFADIYSALETAKADLSGGAVTNLGNQDVALLDAQKNALLAQRGDLGTLMKQIEATSKDLSGQADTLKVLISDQTDADLPTAIAEYTAAQTAYQAALAVSAASFKLSLVDYIRGG